MINVQCAYNGYIHIILVEVLHKGYLSYCHSVVLGKFLQVLIDFLAALQVWDTVVFFVSAANCTRLLFVGLVKKAAPNGDKGMIPIFSF